MELERYNKLIIDSKYNGRCNIIENPDNTTVFKMQEKIALKNKSTNYFSSLSGNDWEDNILARVFFSAENIQIIQNGLRAGVYTMSNTKIVIPPQNIDQLKIIMRSTYLQYAEHLSTDIRKQVERLNKIVWDYVVPTVYNEAVGYVKYMQDQSTLVMPMDLPLHHDREYKQLELKPWF
jgi:phosphopantetheine adenylyltransferase